MGKKALLAAVKDAYKHWPLEVLLSLSSLLSPSSACLLQEIQELNAFLQSKGVDKGVDNTSASDLLSPQDQESKTPLVVCCVRIDLLFAVGSLINYLLMCINLCIHTYFIAYICGGNNYLDLRYV